LKKTWEDSRTDPRTHILHPTQDNPRDCIADIQDRDLPSTYGIQAAGMIAWAYTRTLPGHPVRDLSELKSWLLKTLPANPIVIDKAAMLYHLKNEPPRNEYAW
jgi:hypothetical protein